MRRTPGPAALGLLVLLASCPVTAAAPVLGTLDASSPLLLEGETRVEGPHVLFLATPAGNAPWPHVAADRVTVRHYERAVPTLGGVAVGAAARTSLIHEETYAAADVRLEHPRAGAFLAVHPWGGGAPAYARMDSSGAVLVHARPAGETYGRDPHPLPRASLSVVQGNGRVAIEGDFEVHVWAMRVAVDGLDGTDWYETGEDDSSGPLPAGVRRERWVVAEVAGGTFTFGPGAGAGSAALHLDRMRARVDGVVRLEDARGAFAAGDHAYDARRQAATLEGSLVLDVAPAHARADLGPMPDEDARRARVSLSGDLRGTDLPGLAVRDLAPPLPPQGIAGALLLGALAGRLLWAFYCRLDSAAVLGNASRRRLLDVVRARPGASLREAGRGAGLSKTTAQYHLAVLARFGFVLLARDAPESRTVRVFPLHPAPGAGGLVPRRALVAALSRPRCQRVARALLGVRGRPSALADLARSAALPKPTALRHLRALARAGAVEATGRHRDRRYALTTAGLQELDALAFLFEPPSGGAEGTRAALEGSGGDT